MRVDPGWRRARRGFLPAYVAEGGSRKGVGAGAQRGYEERGRLDGTGFAIVKRNRGAGPIDKHLFASTVVLA